MHSAEICIATVHLFTSSSCTSAAPSCHPSEVTAFQLCSPGTVQSGEINLVLLPFTTMMTFNHTGVRDILLGFVLAKGINLLWKRF